MTVDGNTDETLKSFPGRVLIIDDDPLLRAVLRKFFEGHGSVLVDEAGTGRDAQNLIEAASRPYDLTTLDLSMPEVDGFEFLSYLKQRNVEMRILIISSLPATVIKMAETLADFNTLGAIGHLRKPVSASALNAILKSQTWTADNQPETLQQANA
jgi:CheY-like chemotaxis protein